MKTKSLLRLLATCMALAMMLACNKDNDMGPDSFVNPESPEGKNQAVNILFLPQASTYELPVPRMISNVGDAFFIEQTTPGLSDVKTLQMIDGKTGNVYAAFVTENSALICQCPENGELPANRVLMASQSDEGLRLAVCDMDWGTAEYTVEKETYIEAEVTRSSYGDLDFAARSVDKMLLNIGKSVDAIGDIGGVFDNQVVDAITTAYSLVGISSARYMLWSDDPEMLEEVKEKIITDASTSFILNLLPSSLQRLWHGCSLLYNCGGGNWWAEAGPNASEDGLYEGEPNDGAHMRVRRLSEIAHDTHENMVEWAQTKPKYIVKMSVSNVGESGATFSGSWRLNDGNETAFLQMGYVLTEVNGFTRTIDSWELATVSLTDLKPGTDYKVHAFVKTMMGTYESPQQEFTTDGKLEVLPTSVSFDYKGGTSNVAVTIGSRMTWEVTGTPEWCTVTKSASGDMLTVKVGSTEEARWGDIVITATMPGGNTRTVSIHVEQSAKPVVVPGFAFYQFSGNLETKIHTITWRNGVKESDDIQNLDPVTNMLATILIQNGKYYLTASVGIIPFSQWEVGSTPPPPRDYVSYQEFNQSYSEKKIRISGKCHRRTNESNGWDEDNVTFSLSVTGLNTSTPILTSEWHEHSESFYDWHSHTSRSVSDMWVTQSLAGTKMY